MFDLKTWSIQRKLVLSMAGSLLAYALISGLLGGRLIGNAVRERIVDEELPTVVAAIRADVQRQISQPLSTARRRRQHLRADLVRRRAE